MEDFFSFVFIILFLVIPGIANFMKKRKEKAAREEAGEPSAKPAKTAARQAPKPARPAKIAAPQPKQHTSDGWNRIEPEPVQRDVRAISQEMKEQDHSTKERQRGMRSWQDTTEPDLEESISSETSFLEEMFGITIEQPPQPQRPPAKIPARPKMVRPQSGAGQKAVTKKSAAQRKDKKQVMKPTPAGSATKIDFANLTGDQLKKSIMIMEVLGTPRSKRMPESGGMLPRIF
jgi:hypothetical protein